MITNQTRNDARRKRHGRVRSRVMGTPDRPRLKVYRSNKHIYAQLIDDLNGVTLASASTNDKELSLDATSNVEAAGKVGELVAERAKEKDIEKVVFDRGGYLFHGRVKALAEAAREAGLKF